MEKVNHNNVPEAIEFLIRKVESLESIMLQSGKSPELETYDRIDRIADACKILNCSKSKLYKLTMCDEVPHSHTKTGRLIFSKQELIKWLEENTIVEKKTNNVLQNIAESAARKVK
ncbi:MAG: helix-turn-helix domain-containing protein [Bacteroidales bacterium]